MRISDWSSDVCSSDLVIEEETGPLDDTGEEYADYVQITDDSGSISVEVPSEWADVDGTPITLDDGTELQNVSAAPDLAAFFGAWTSPEIGRATCRERLVQRVSIPVGDGHLKKK